VRLRFRRDVAPRVRTRHYRNLHIDHTTDDGTNPTNRVT
jgi:hypothetical protein